MDHTGEGNAILSDDALRGWEEQVEDAVSAAIDHRPLDGYSDDHDPGPDPATVAEEEQVLDKRQWMEESYIGELLVDSEASAADAFKVCLDLKSNLKSEIISIFHSKKGTTIKCTVPNPVTLVGSIYKHPGISAWALTAQ